MAVSWKIYNQMVKAGVLQNVLHSEFSSVELYNHELQE